MSRADISRAFDSLIEHLSAGSLSKLRTDTESFNLLIEALLELKRISLLNSLPSEPVILSDAETEQLLAAGHAETWRVVRQRIVRSLKIYCPGPVDVPRASEILLFLLSSSSPTSDVDYLCEGVALRYCNIVNIDQCSMDATYVETTVRVALGLFGDIPPPTSDVAASIKSASAILNLLRRARAIAVRHGGPRVA